MDLRLPSLFAPAAGGLAGPLPTPPVPTSRPAPLAVRKRPAAEPLVGVQTPLTARRSLALSAATATQPADRREAAAPLVLRQDGEPTIPKLVQLQIDADGVKHPALFAEMDEGLVLCTRTPDAEGAAEGIFTVGLASCVAVILQSDDAIALAHTSATGGDLHEFISWCIRSFSQHSHTPERLTLGYNPSGVSQEVSACGLQPFATLLKDYRGLFNGSARVALAIKGTDAHTKAERVARLSRNVAFNHSRWIAHLANRFGADTVQLHKASVLVPRFGGALNTSLPAQEEPAPAEAPPLRETKSRVPKRTREAASGPKDHTRRARVDHKEVAGEESTGRAGPRAMAPVDAAAILAAAVPGRPPESPRAPVRVFVGTTRICEHALAADMDEGLFTALRKEAIDGLYSEGFASCVALVLASDTLIGLAHLAMVGHDLREAVKSCRQDFSKLVLALEGRAHGAIHLTLGYSPHALRQALEDEADRDDIDTFIDSYECFTRQGYDSLVAADRALHAEAERTARPAPTDAERLDHAISSFLASKRRELEDIAGSRTIVLPHGALLVRTDGRIDTFTAMPRSEPR